MKRRKRKSPFIEDQALEENDKGATIVVDLKEGGSEDSEQDPGDFGDFINDADEEGEENDDSEAEDEEDDLTSSLYCPIDGMPYNWAPFPSFAAIRLTALFPGVRAARATWAICLALWRKRQQNLYG
ncbi:hypothetical protein ACROYT_G014655 [Oculina patagonica]